MLSDHHQRTSTVDGNGVQRSNTPCLPIRENVSESKVETNATENDACAVPPSANPSPAIARTLQARPVHKSAPPRPCQSQGPAQLQATTVPKLPSNNVTAFHQ